MPEDKAPQHGAARERHDPAAETEPLPAGKEDRQDHSSCDPSDVVLADAETGQAPSFRAPPSPGPQPPVRKSAGDRPMALLPGARLDDFEIIRLLGRGAFGHVYLARQISLDREVALKVSANRGSEGRTMARLEHQHIVQVFSECVEPEFNQRILCMQLVPGVGLDRIIAALHPSGTEPAAAAHRTAALSGLDDAARHSTWTGRELLAIIDRSASLPSALDPSALHDRQALAGMDDVEATAWMGTRLAEALDFAHRHGVLHRDIKPANILLNSYGQPLLADFNISSQPVGSQSQAEEMFGGTFAYMAPEHLDAFNPSDPTGAEAVTARSDLYSLGLVLHQLLAGRLPVPLPQRRETLADTLRAAADARRRVRPAPSPGVPTARKTLQRSIGRCVEPAAEDRPSTGAALADQLDGCRQLRHAERRLPPLRAVFEPMLRRPFLWLILLAVLPQLVGSAVNITYNQSQIVGELAAAQQRVLAQLVAQHSLIVHPASLPQVAGSAVNVAYNAWRIVAESSVLQHRVFRQLVVGYNLVVYPIALALFAFALQRVWRGWQALCSTAAAAEKRVAAARREALRLPLWIAGLTAFGWFPGGLLFPLVIQTATGDFSLGVTAHFFASFFLSGLIALAYSLCGVQFIVLRALYPAMWCDVRRFDETARRELSPMASRLGWIQVLAVSIPLVAVMLMLLTGGQTDHEGFRWLAAGLIVLGIVGLHVTGAVTRGLSQVVATLTSEKA